MDSHTREHMPRFLDEYVRALRFSLSWTDGEVVDFEAWRETARARVLDCLLYDPPECDFAPEVLGEEDCGSYVQRRISFAPSPWYRVPAYLLVPKGDGPFPAMVVCHDHGAFFYWGKEKVVATGADAHPALAEFKRCSYGGRSIANELAERGYAVIAIDALHWGERAVRGVGESELDLATADGVLAFNRLAVEAQAMMGINLLNAGICWSGVIVRDDLRTAQFLASLPEVDEARIGSCGLSVGCWRSWHLAALSELIRASVNICWMTRVQPQLLGRMNFARSTSAMSMTIPGLRGLMDFPDVASLIAPRPALFFNGLQDGLFPIASVEDAYARMALAWDAAGASERLCTRLWDVPHTFDERMQADAFAWLDGWLLA